MRPNRYALLPAALIGLAGGEVALLLFPLHASAFPYLLAIGFFLGAALLSLHRPNHSVNYTARAFLIFLGAALVGAAMMQGQNRFPLTYSDIGDFACGLLFLPTVVWSARSLEEIEGVRAGSILHSLFTAAVWRPALVSGAVAVLLATSNDSDELAHALLAICTVGSFLGLVHALSIRNRIEHLRSHSDLGVGDDVVEHLLPQDGLYRSAAKTVERIICGSLEQARRLAVNECWKCAAAFTVCGLCAAVDVYRIVQAIAL